MVGRQHFIPLTKVVFAELSGGIPVEHQQTGNGGLLFMHSLFGARHSHLGEAVAKYAFPRDRGRAAGGEP